jgi:hypothetical protein
MQGGRAYLLSVTGRPPCGAVAPIDRDDQMAVQCAVIDLGAGTGLIATGYY